MKYVFAMVAILITPQAYAVEWIYLAPGNLSSKQVIITPNSIGGHRSASGNICHEDDLYICYKSKSFNFAFPLDNINHSRWAFGGFNYSAMKYESVSMLGMPVDVIEIEQRRGKKPVMKFLFSRKKGLLAFRVLESNAPLFLLENHCGFGASSTCQEPRQQ